MVYSDLKLYLKTTLSNPSLDFKWTQKDNEDFFAFIRKSFPKNHLVDDTNKATIKQAFKEYFEHVGYIVFQLKEDQIRLKVLPYKIEPKDSVNLSQIVEIINDSKDLIEFGYKGNENQILVGQELREILFDVIENIETEEINKKELIKYALKKALKLDANDIVVVKGTSIFIKLLSQLKRKYISSEGKDVAERRFNGIDEEELVSFYEEYFSNDHKNFFSLVAKLFVNKFFIERKIDNAEYEKNVFGYIQAIIIEQLIESFDHHDDFFKGFSGYVFRIHFQEVFAYISDLILHELSISNAYMNEFLKYYSLNVIVVNGEKYQVPVLEADNGLRWNVISIISIAKVYIRVKLSLEKLHVDVDNLEEEISKMYIGKSSPVEYNESLAKNKEKLSRHIVYETRELRICSDKYDMAKNQEEKRRLKVKLQHFEERIKKSQQEKDNMETRIVEASVIKKYTQLEAKLQKYQRQIRAEDKILSQNTHSYISVKKSITKALISKKKRIQ